MSGKDLIDMRYSPTGRMRECLITRLCGVLNPKAETRIAVILANEATLRPGLGTIIRSRLPKSDVGFRLQDLSAAVLARLEVDVVRAAALAGFLVL